MSLPTSGYFTAIGRNNGEAKQAQDDILEYLLAITTLGEGMLGAESAAAARALLGLPGALAGEGNALVRVAAGEGGLETAQLPAAQGRAASHDASGAATTTLSAAEYACPVVVLTGALTSDHDVVFPASAGTWIVRNSCTGDYALTLKPSGGAGIVLDQGERSIVVVISDGSTMRELSRSKTVGGSFTRDLTLASGSSSVDLGGRPRRVDIQARDPGTGVISIGTCNPDRQSCLFQLGAGGGFGSQSGSYTAVIEQTVGTNIYYANVVFTSAGFTVNWAKVGSTTGTITFDYTAELED